MFGHGGLVKVFVATRPVDFRKGSDGLALAVQEMFGMDPFCGSVRSGSKLLRWVFRWHEWLGVKR